MRLICPNCDAIYEVDDAAIPDTGRDVQCSNCGHGWFQLPEGAEPAIDDLTTAFADGDDEDDPIPRMMPETLPEPAAPAAAAEPQRRRLDDDILAVLREEAEREAAARRAEAPAMETQVEMDMPPAPPPAATGVIAGAARRIAQMKGIDPDPTPAPPPRAGSRRDLLPDIEEINSSLSPAADGADGMPDEGETVAARSSGFRTGFTAMLLVAAGVVAVYAMAPRLGEQIPAAAPWLESYVGTVDGARLWLDGVLRQATAVVRGLTAQQGG